MSERLVTLNKMKNVVISNEVVTSAAAAAGAYEGLATFANAKDGNVGLAMFLGFATVGYLVWTVRGITKEINKINRHLKPAGQKS